MNKCIRQNWKIRSHIEFCSLGKYEFPKEEKEWYLKCDEIWRHLVLDDLKRHACFIKKGTGWEKHNITVWDDGEYCYLIQCVRTRYGQDKIRVYINDLTESNVSDFIVEAKFIHKNVWKILKTSQENVSEFNKMVAAQEIQKEYDNPGEA